MKKSSTYARKLYAITEAITRWQQYLLGAHFTIRTDQKSTKELMQEVMQTLEQLCFFVKLLRYHYSIEYKSSSTNKVTDALSRKTFEQLTKSSQSPVDETTKGVTLFLLSQQVVDILQNIRAKLDSKPKMQ